MPRKSTSSRREHTSQSTTDHEKIRNWVEERGGHPACVKGTGGRGDTGMLRIDFPGYSGAKSLKGISWDEFFEKFDDQDLAFLYQDETASGRRSNFNKLISRETAAESKRNPNRSSRRRHGRSAR